jgi:MFS family permease
MTVGIGALGCVAGGLFADRLGRTTLTMLAMAVSGTCAATVGLLFGEDPWLLSAVCLICGVSIVADSAQFSASIAELEPYVSASGQTTTLSDTVFSTVPGAPVFVGKAPIYRSKNAKLDINIDIKNHNALQSTFEFQC